MKHIIFILLTTVLLLGCASKKPKDDPYSVAQANFKAKHYEEAAAELMPLAQKGNPEAQYTLGYMYYYGLGMKRDRTQGYFWLQSAASNGNPKANTALELLTADARARITD